MFLLEAFLSQIILLAFNFTHSYGWSIIILAIVLNIILIPFYYLARKIELKERAAQKIINPKVKLINSIKNGRVRQAQLNHLYKSYNYWPFYSLRSLTSLLIQIPFFIAAYQVLSVGMDVKIPFLFISNLNKPDALFFGVNLLPIIMTLINVWSTNLVPHFTDRDRKQAYILAVFFLVLLYNATSALVLYWTINNLISFSRNLYYYIKERDSYKDIIAPHKYLNAANIQKLNVILTYLAIYFCINIFFLNLPLSAYILTPRIILNLNAVLFMGVCFLGISLKMSLILIKYRVNNLLSILISILFAAIIVMLTAKIKVYAPFILLGIIFVLGAIDPNRRQEKDIKLGKSIALIVLIMLLPAVLYLYSNLEYFNGPQIIFYFFILLLFAVICHLLVFYTSKSISLSMTTMFSMAFIFAFMFLPLIREQIYYTAKTSMDFIIVFALFIFIFSLFIRKVKFVMFFLSFATVCLAVLTVHQGVKNYYVVKALHEKTTAGSNIPSETHNLSPNKLTNKIPEPFFALQMEEKPNVYLLIYDSLPRKEVIDAVGLSYDDFYNMLKGFKFNVYEEVYSIAPVSLDSDSSLLDIRKTTFFATDLEKKQINAGNSLVDQVFTYNGYYTVLANSVNPHMYGYALNFDETLDFKPYSLINEVLIGIAQGTLDSLQLTEQGFFKSEDYSLISDYVKKGIDKNVFIRTHYSLPGHGNNKLPFVEQRSWWTTQYLAALGYLENELEAITTFDPDAIIIVVGDHGPHILGDATYSYYTMSPEELGEIHLLDMWGVTLAIRWPDPERAAKYDDNIVVVQNIFPVVFAYLFDSPLPLNYKIRNTMVWLRGHEYDNGQFRPFAYETDWSLLNRGPETGDILELHPSLRQLNIQP